METLEMFRGLAVLVGIVVVTSILLRSFYMATKAANSAMNEWPWYWPKSWRHYDPND